MYRPLLLLVILILSPLSSIFSQSVNFEDGFEDQDISDWSGTTGDFTYTVENGNTLLQQDAIDDTAPSYLSIPSTSVEGYWEFFIRMDFAPSGGNKTEIYLMSDSQDLTGNLNGYKLLAGESGTTDVFRLFRITNGAEDGEVLTGSTNISSGGDYRVKVTRDGSGNWTLEVGESYAGALSEEDTGTDNTYTSASHFGFKTTYSSTRTDLFAFDFRIDIPPIEVQELTTISDSELDITFSRPINFSTAQASDFTLNPGNLNSSSVTQQSPNMVRVAFAENFPSGENLLNISGIEDQNGETALSDTTITFFIHDDYQPGDIIISEFMKDPPPGTTEEYIELQNTSNRYLNLKDWQLGDNSNLSTITSSTLTILPDSFIVITSDTEALSSIFGDGPYFQSSFPALNNNEDQVRVFDDQGNLVDSLAYNSSWGGIDVALERRRTSVSSTFRENWGDSPAENFGTPGISNMVEPDETAPEISEIIFQSNQILLMVTNEHLETTAAENASNYILSQASGSETTPPPIPAVTTASQIAGDTVQINLDSPIQEFDANWILTVNNLTDIFSNAGTDTFEFDFENPFFVDSVSAIQNDQILVTFSKNVDFASVQINDFNLNGNTFDPLSNITQPALNQVQLELEAELQSGIFYLNVSSIESTDGWVISDNSSFKFFLFDAFATGDIIINEFMYDQPEGAAEFVELKNTSGKFLNLKDWKIGDNSSITSISAEDFVIPPDTFLVLTSNTTSLQSYFGPANYHQISLPALNNTGSEQIRVFDASENIADSLEYTSSWGGNEVSLERRSASVSSTYMENWGDSPAENFGTPGHQNEIEADIIAPSIRNFEILSASELLVSFSERIQESPASNLANFSLTANNVTELPALQTVTFSSPNSIHIEFEDSLPRQPNGTDYVLNIQNQADIFGNIAGTLSHPFFLITYATSDSGEVFISEFMYDPAENYSEFIELYNQTDKAYNLQNWTYNDNSGNRKVISDVEFSLNPGSYIILTPDSTIPQNFNDIPFIEMGSRFSALNNSEDAIVIRNENGVLIDSLTYYSSWGGSEVSLERRSFDVTGIYKENWGNSPAVSFATPGAANQILPDDSPPLLQNAFISAPDTIQLVFDEQLIPSSATNPQNFTFSPAINISEIRHQTNRITLVLSSILTDGQSLTITVRNQSDIFGNLRNEINTTLEFTAFSPANRGDVIVNEILYQRATAESEEFIELLNISDKNFDLSNWTFSDARSSATIPEGTQIRSGEYLILTDTQILAKLAKPQSAQLNEDLNKVYIPGFPSLNDDEDAVIIKNSDGIVIDSLFYQESWGGNAPGVSLERKDPLSASNDGSNWASNTSESGNSAGRASSVYQPDETPPEIIFARLQNDGNIFVSFSEFIRLNGTTVTVNGDSYAISGYNSSEANKVIIGNQNFGANEPLSVTFNQVADYRGNISQNLTVEVSMPLNKRSVVINEILYDPLANTDDNLPDQTEFIELYNRSEFAISLEGIYLHDEPDENNEVRTIHPVNSTFKWIPPGGYVVFYAENEATEFSDSKLAKYFEMENTDERYVIRTDRSSLSLASSDDAIYLADSSGAVIDSVFYDENWQNPNLYDTKGVSLERINPDGPSDDESNWSSSTQVSGGTPGEQNSIFQLSAGGPENTGITFSPNPFSPDDDGFEDNLFINYNLDEPDYLLRVRIFDRYGRLVRKLADGKQAGFEGSLIWDGNMDNKSRNRVGIYIVLFEAYNSANGKNRTFKETVVIARKF